MGSVWYAEHLSLHASVALKLIDTPAIPDPMSTERFLREARLAAALRSPHVVQILDHGVDAGAPYIVMELLEGESLATRLERVGRLSAAETARMIQHVARAMTRAHEAGIIHRDLKPENVFIVRNDDEEIYKVFDFGIAKVETPALGGVGAATRTGSLLGTPSYMSPEQAEGVKALDQRADIWALGVIAYRCLLGRLPFAETTLPQLILAICARPLPIPSHHGAVPDGFDAWFARVCARSPADRFDSARKASIELSAVLGDATTVPEEVTMLNPVPLPAGPTPTTSHFANSEVIARRIHSNKRFALPILLALALPVVALIVSRVTASLERRPPPEPAVVAAASAGPPATVPELEQTPQALQPRVEPPTETRGYYADLPSGVRLTEGVRVVPSLPRAERTPATPAPEAAPSVPPATAQPSPSTLAPAILPSIYPPETLAESTRPGRGTEEQLPEAKPAPTPKRRTPAKRAMHHR